MGFPKEEQVVEDLTNRQMHYYSNALNIYRRVCFIAMMLLRSRTKCVRSPVKQKQMAMAFEWISSGTQMHHCSDGARTIEKLLCVSKEQDERVTFSSVRAGFA